MWGFLFILAKNAPAVALHVSPWSPACSPTFLPTCVNPLALCWAAHLPSAAVQLGRAAVAHVASLHGVSLSFAKRFHPTAMIRLQKQAQQTLFLLLQGSAMRVNKGVTVTSILESLRHLSSIRSWAPKCLYTFCSIQIGERVTVRAFICFRKQNG